jgi:hypothetical protein
VAENWDVIPFVDIMVTDELATECPSTHPDPVLDRIFFGTNAACDCTGHFNEAIEYYDQVNKNRLCTKNEIRAGC